MLPGADDKEGIVAIGGWTEGDLQMNKEMKTNNTRTFQHAHFTHVFFVTPRDDIEPMQ